MKPSFLTTLLLLTYLQAVWCTKGEDIAKEAKKFIGCKMWSNASNYGTGKYTEKYALFVYDVLDCVDAHPLKRWRKNNSGDFYQEPIDATEWENPNSPFLSRSRFWRKCVMPHQLGDIISDGHHVGIITGDLLVTLADDNKVEEEGIGEISPIKACWRHC